MIKADRHTEEGNRAGYAFSLLSSSGYSEPEQDIIANQISNGSSDEIEQVIEDLIMNHIDAWSSYRQKDINYRLNRHEI